MTLATRPRPRGVIGAEQHGLPHRPIEDRGFEAVETTIGMVFGVVVGLTAGGPVGGVIGGLLGAGIAFALGEALERAQGLAALTTDAEQPESGPARSARGPRGYAR